MSTNHLELGADGKARGFFEQDAAFSPASDFVRSLIKEYEKACFRSARRSNRLLFDASSETRDSAIWAEAQAQTLERLLCIFLVSEEIEPPPVFKLPDFRE